MDGDRLRRPDDQGHREEDGGTNGPATLERAIVDEWRRFVPGGESGQLRRQLRRRQRAERKLKQRMRRKERGIARRRERQLVNIERQLLGRSPGRFSFSLPFAKRQEEEEESTGRSELDSRIAAAVEQALARQREELIREFQQTIDFRVRLAVKAMEHRQQESEERVVERAEKAISRVTGDMAQSLDRRLGKEAERIEKEVERSIGVEMGRMYLRLSKPAEGDALPGRRP